MRLAIISDIHGNIDALEAVLADIARRGIEDIVNLGDSLSGPFDAVAVAERLIGLGLPTVSGNHDRALWDRPRESMGLWESWIVDELAPNHLDWLRGLPASVTLGEVLCCHATPESDHENWLDRRGPDQRLIARDLDGVLERLGGATAPVIACGHTHTPRLVRLPTGQAVVNPGAVGCPAYLDARTEPAFIHQTGAPDARYAVLERAGDTWRADLVAVPYDSRAMARLARQRGAEDWAKAVETGWFV